MKIDTAKKYRTKGHLPVVVYAVYPDGQSPCAVHGAYQLPCGKWYACGWNAEGQAHPPCAFDLVEVKPRIKRTVWLNVYGPEKDSVVCAHRTRECADRIDSNYAAHRIACIKIEIDCEEGEGLS